MTVINKFSSSPYRCIVCTAVGYIVCPRRSDSGARTKNIESGEKKNEKRLALLAFSSALNIFRSRANI